MEMQPRLYKKQLVVGIFQLLMKKIILTSLVDGLLDRKIINNNKDFEIKMYVSHDNLTKLRENINKYTGYVWFE